MSRGDDLRRLAAQLTVLAELEDSVAVGISRVLGSAGTAAGSHAASAAATASPVASSTSLRELSSHEAATALPRAAATTAASSRARSRSRSPVPLPKRAPRRFSTVSVARGSVALAESGLVTGLPVKSCPPVPTAQLRLSRVSRESAAASGTPRPSGEASEAPAPAQASEASSVPDVASDSDSDWDALPDAHGLAPPPNRCSRRRPAGRRRWSWSARSRQAPPSPAQSRQALHVARDLNALAVSHRPHGCACAVTGCGFGPGCEHTSEDHGEELAELADLVFSCAVVAGGEGVICTFPRTMGTLCRLWAFLVLLALDVARTLLGVMSLNSRIRWWRLLE